MTSMLPARDQLPDDWRSAQFSGSGSGISQLVDVNVPIVAGCARRVLAAVVCERSGPVSRPGVRHASAERLGRAGWQAGYLPGPEAAVKVGGLVQADSTQGGHGEGGGVALGAHDDDLRIGAGGRGNAGLAARVQPPLQHV